MDESASFFMVLKSDLENKLRENRKGGESGYVLSKKAPNRDKEKPDYY